jgi:hypothetical protein
MGSYAENEQDAREYAELQRQFAEEKLEEQKERAKEEKPVVTMDEIIQHRFQQRSLENAKRHMQAQNDWSAYLEKYENPDGDYERSDEELAILKEINQIVENNIVYGTPPYSIESAEEILLDILNDLTSMKERLGLGGNI